MNATPPVPKKPMTPLTMAASLLGAAFGWYCGVMIVIPLVAMMAALLVARRLGWRIGEPLQPAFFLIFGHGVWLLTAVLFVPSAAGAVLPDLVVIAAGLAWLGVRPGLGPVILLALYEVVSLIVNIDKIRHFDIGTMNHKALAAHIGLRVCALVMLFNGYRRFRRPPAVPPPVPGVEG